MRRFPSVCSQKHSVMGEAVVSIDQVFAHPCRSSADVDPCGQSSGYINYYYITLCLWQGCNGNSNSLGGGGAVTDYLIAFQLFPEKKKKKSWQRRDTPFTHMKQLVSGNLKELKCNAARVASKKGVVILGTTRSLRQILRNVFRSGFLAFEAIL